jgi:hypothetical protein
MGKSGAAATAKECRASNEFFIMKKKPTTVVVVAHENDFI